MMFRWLCLTGVLCLSGLACTPALLRLDQRAGPEEAISNEAVKLIDAQSLGGAPINSTELVLALFRAHVSLKGRVPLSITPRGLRTLGVRRSGPPQRGDLLVFKELPNTLDVAVITEVRGAQAVKAVGILRGAPRALLIHLGQPDVRRVEGELVNTYVRGASLDETGAIAEGGYLAGELLVDVRALF